MGDGDGPLGELSDEELVRRALSGDSSAERKAAFGAIYRRHEGLVVRFCSGRLGDLAAEDASAETFEAALGSLATLAEPHTLPRWLLGIANNRCRGEWKRRDRRGDMPTYEELDEPRVYEQASRARQARVDRMLDAVVATFTEKQQLLFSAAFREGLKGQDLAARLGVNSAQSSRLTHDLKKIASDGFGAFVLAHEGRPHCPKLAKILDDSAWNGDNFTALLRERITRHIDDCKICDNCAICKEQRKKLVSPYAPVLIPALILPAVWERVQEKILQLSVMAVAHSPTVQRRRLRMELRRARDAAGLSQADVARAMDWSPSKLIRIERGDVNVSTNDLRVLLSHYGVKDKGRVNELLELARSARGASFYDQYADLLKPGFKEYLAYEVSASVIRQYDPVLVPGLIQTEEYARALFRDMGRLDPETADKVWAVRRHRQQVHERHNPPEILAILDEAALRRHVGRRHTMLHQLARIRDLADKDHITIQIMPFAHGAHPGMEGNFVVLEFADPNLDPLVHLEHLDSITIRDDTEQIDTYLDRFEQIQDKALPPDKSKDFLDALVDDMSSSTTPGAS